LTFFHFDVNGVAVTVQLGSHFLKIQKEAKMPEADAMNRR
jgi:hypothetical protein